MVTQLSQPRETDFGASIASRKEGPIGIVVATLSSPCGEEVEPLRDISTTRATHIPWRLSTGGPRTFGIRHRQIAKADRDLESRLVQLAGGVDGVDDVLPQTVGGIIAGGVCAVCSDADKGNFAGRRTAGRAADSRSKINASRVT